MPQNNFQKYLKKSLTIFGAAFILTLGFYAGLFVDAKINDQVAASIDGPKITINALNLLGNKDQEDLAEFWKVWNLLEKKYVPVDDKKTITKEDKIYGAIKGLVESYGDPYTEFLPPKENKDLADQLSGSLEGVGMTVGLKEGNLVVIAPLKGSPAEKAGVLPGDRILKIGEVEAKGFSIEEAVKLIRGPKGTKVTITFGREGKTEPVIITITRELITLPIVETKKYPNEKVFVITLSEFTSNSTSLFRKALKEYVESGYTRLILDLRNNPGGYLEAAVDMASWFLPPGKIVVVEDFADKDKADVEFRSKGYNIFNKNLKMVVLINEGSASASEILGGALQDYKIAELVGTKSFGKGVVQEIFPLSKGAAVKITIAKWLTPNGKNLSKDGLVPDVEVKNTPEDIKAQKDPQLQKAIDLLKSR